MHIVLVSGTKVVALIVSVPMIPIFSRIPLKLEFFKTNSDMLKIIDAAAGARE